MLSLALGHPIRALARQLDRADHLRASLHAMVAREASDPQNPWDVMHGIRALGPSFALRDGRPAVGTLLRQVVRVAEIKGRRLLFVDEKDEGHSNVFLKTLLEAGVPWETSFPVQGVRYTLKDLFESARLRFRFDPQDRETIRTNLAWSLIAFAHRPERRWTNLHGERIDLLEVVEVALEAYEAAMREFRGTLGPDGVPGLKSEIHRFTCGGAHVLYSLETCARAGLVTAGQRKRLEVQLDLHFPRLRQEIALIKTFFRRAERQMGPEVVRLPEADASLKFLGHSLEVIGYGANHGLLGLAPARQQAVDETRAELVRAVAAMEREDLTALRGRNADLARNLVGDACHALRGVRLLTGERT